MCSNWKRDYNKLDFKTISTLVAELASLGTREIRLTGGEPTLHKEFNRIIRLVKENNIDVSMITNGSVITPSVLHEIIDCDMKRIFVSIDSPVADLHDYMRGGKGFWRKAIQTLREIASAKKEHGSNIRVTINTVVSKLNYDQIPDLVRLRNHVPFDEVNLIPVKNTPCLYLESKQILHYNTTIVPEIEENLKQTKVEVISNDLYVFGRLEEEIEDSTRGMYTKKIYDEISCSICYFSVYIDELGNVFPCCNFPYKGKKFACGNIYESSFNQIWHGKTLRNIREKVAGVSKHCFECDPANVSFNVSAFQMQKRYK